ncbi:hypothetical protein CYMTET_10662 [Cymbomonas tetramitiformis]|uniref:EF-hand domain-containing protein n=1 Tax=Cymbomonas tetramitiformis TaxID=36881 RepID=A0AAE0GP57_9CHLO|nr:hypothetical protein CYMTET_10662 [Cymbomonas tetramitiformis]
MVRDKSAPARAPLRPHNPVVNARPCRRQRTEAFSGAGHFRAADDTPSDLPPLKQHAPFEKAAESAAVNRYSVYKRASRKVQPAAAFVKHSSATASPTSPSFMERMNQQKSSPYRKNAAFVPYIGNDGRENFHSVSETLKLHELFSAIDTDGNGTVDIEEVENLARSRTFGDNLGSVTIAAFFARESTNRTEIRKSFLQNVQSTLRVKSSLTFSDFLRLAHPEADDEVIQKMQDALGKHLGRKNAAKLSRAQDRWQKVCDEELARQTAWVNSMWKIWDQDGNGELDKMEFKVVVEELGASDSETEQYFADIDVNEHGVITKEEFAKWWASIQLGGVRDYLSPEPDASPPLISAY